MMMRVLSATLAVDGCTPINWRKDVAEDILEGASCLYLVLFCLRMFKGLSTTSV